MTTSAAAFMRASNLIVMDYPYAAAVASALRLCDELCVVVGQSVDATRDAIYALQHEYGADSIKIKEEVWTFDRGWQERWWDSCREMTKAEWHFVQDADEMIHEDYAGVVRGFMEEPDLAHINVMVFPFVHFYGTDHHRVVHPRFYPYNSRLGRASAGYRMRNWCSDRQPHLPACMMVVQQDGREIGAHGLRGAPAVVLDIPILHYGWCRSLRGLAISQAKHYAWYADGGGLQDGRVPELPPYDLAFADRLATGFIEPIDVRHPAAMQPWLQAHAPEWYQTEVLAKAAAQMKATP